MKTRKQKGGDGNNKYYFNPQQIHRSVVRKNDPLIEINPTNIVENITYRNINVNKTNKNNNTVFKNNPMYVKYNSAYQKGNIDFVSKNSRKKHFSPINITKRSNTAKNINYKKPSLSKYNNTKQGKLITFKKLDRNSGMRKLIEPRLKRNSGTRKLFDKLNNINQNF